MMNLAILTIFIVLSFSGCASPQKQAWDHYEKGMLLVFGGYDPSKDSEDKVEKNYLKALQYNPKLPGVNASLGTYEAKKGNNQAASEYFEKEITLHQDAAQALMLVLNKDLIKKDDKSVLKPKNDAKNIAAGNQSATKQAAAP